MTLKQSIILGIIIAVVVISLVFVLVELGIGQKKNEALAGWQAFTPESRFFTAQFPYAPELFTQQIPIADSDMFLDQELYYASDNNGNSYYVVTSLYPKPFNEEAADELLTAALEGMVNAAPNQELINSSPIKYKNVSALSFIMQGQNEKTLYQGNIFFKDRVLYQVFILYTEGLIAEDEVVHFFKSFELLI